MMIANKKNGGFLLTGIAPALSDILIILDDCTYQKLLVLLNLSPGEWLSVSSLKELENILLTLPLKNQLLLNQTMKAGSSILGIMSSMSYDIREKSCIISSVGNSTDYVSQMSVDKFVNAADKLGIKHKAFCAKGSNAVGLVLTSDTSPEKVLLTYKGVSHQLRLSPNDVDSEYLLVDAYELTDGLIAESIESLIKSRKYKVILSLGNTSILKGRLLLQICDYLKSNLVHCLSGNMDEFNKLSPKLKKYINIRSDELFENVPYILLTMGKNGLVGFFYEEMQYQRAFPSKNVISTSGAGDIALGVFITGIIKKTPHDKIMRECAYYASKILNRLTSMFQDGIESEH